MDLTRIIAITGRPGLFELISQTKGGFIVKDLVSQKKLSISANSQVSLLQNISIYTQDSEIALASVLVNISKNQKYSEIKFTKNESSALRSLMLEVQPDYAADKVYDSDLKKLFSWYNILVKNSIITEESIKNFEEAVAKAEEEMAAAEVEKAEVKEEEPKKAKATAKTKKTEETGVTEKKETKKAAPKKKKIE